MKFSEACDAVSRHDQSRAMGQSLAPVGQAGAQVVGAVLRWAVLDHYGPKAHAARDPEAALRCFLEALESS